MLLDTLRMQNFRQHADTFITFERGLTGIVGTNGAGKSTVLEAIVFALYGTPATRGNKESIKSRRAGDRATVRVELVFALAGHRYRVTRGLNMAEVYLDDAESPVANSLSGVSEFLQRTLGMTRQEFFRTYFTAQKDLAAMNSLSGPERAKFLARALGYDKIASAQFIVTDRRKAIVSELAGIRLIMPDVDRARAEVQAETELLQTLTTQARLATIEKDRVSDSLALLKPRWQSAQETRERDQRLSSDVNLIGSQVESLTRDRNRLETEWSSLVTARTEHDRLTPQLANLPPLRAELTELDRTFAADVEQQQSRGRLASLDEQLSRIDGQLHAIGDHRALLADAVAAETYAAKVHDNAAEKAQDLTTRWSEQQFAAKSEIDALRSKHQVAMARRTELLAKGADGACSACGKPLGADWEAAIAQVDAELAELVATGKAKRELADSLANRPAIVSASLLARDTARAELNGATARVTDAQTLCGTAERLSAERTTVSRMRQVAEQLVASTASPYNAARHVEVRAELERLGATDKRVAVLAGQLQREAPCQSELIAAIGALKGAETRRASLQAERDAIGFSEANFVALKLEYEQTNEQLQTLTTNEVTAISQRDRTQHALSIAEQRVAQCAEAREKITVLDVERVRLEELERAFTELRTVLNTNLRPELAEIASGLLEVLTDGRYTEADFDENYVLTLMKDGITQPVISGGEEDLCNLVLRLAISQMIAARAGHAVSLLILDEVFGSMDETRRNNVVELLRALNDRFEQVIVITHIDVSRSLDHIIQVSYDADLDYSVVASGEAGATMSQDAELMAAA